MTCGVASKASEQNIGDGANEMGDNLVPVDLGPGRTAVALASCYLSNCALLDNGKVKCWGDNALGQLGVGDTNIRPSATYPNLLDVDLGTGRTVK